MASFCVWVRIQDTDHSVAITGNANSLLDLVKYLPIQEPLLDVRNVSEFSTFLNVL